MTIDDIINLFSNLYPNREIVRMSKYNSTIAILAPEKNIPIDFSDPFFIVRDKNIEPFLPSSIKERSEFFSSMEQECIYQK